MTKWFLIAIFALASNLQAEAKVLAFAGSTREDSYNKQLVLEAAKIARTLGAKVQVIDLRDYPMPFYDADLEKNAGMPENAKKLRNLMIQSSHIIISSPEYNSSIPAVLKNALDWASRSEDADQSDAAFQNKKFALMSASPGRSGGKRGLVHLRAVIEDIGGTVIQKEVSVPQAYKAFNEKGELENSSLNNDLKQEIKELLQPSK